MGQLRRLGHANVLDHQEGKFLQHLANTVWIIVNVHQILADNVSTGKMAVK